MRVLFFVVCFLTTQVPCLTLPPRGFLWPHLSNEGLLGGVLFSQQQVWEESQAEREASLTVTPLPKA